MLHECSDMIQKIRSYLRIRIKFVIKNVFDIDNIEFD